MAFGLSGIIHGMRMGLRRKLLGFKEEMIMKSTSVPKGYLAVYVGEDEKKRHVVPVSYLNEPTFQELLSTREEEFGYKHSMGGLTFPCTEVIFFGLTSQF